MAWSAGDPPGPYSLTLVALSFSTRRHQGSADIYIYIYMANISTHRANINVVGLNHTHFCTLCEYGCDSNQQLETHQFKHHGVKDRIRLYVSGTRCPICLKEFWQREVYLNHIKRGRTPCRRQVVLRGPVLTEAQAAEIDSELRPFCCKQQRRGLRRHAVECPCIRVHGPKMRFIYGPVRG